MPRLLALTVAFVLALLGGCSAGGSTTDARGVSDTGEVAGRAGEAGEPGTAGGSATLTWGEGSSGVVLVHGAAFDAASWEDQAVAIAAQGATVIAVEDISTDAIAAAVEQLQGDGRRGVALVGGSAGADAILRLASDRPGIAEQLVLLSPNTVVGGLSEVPALFIASEGEPGADIPQQLVDANPGADAEVLLVGGSAHAQNLFDSEQADEVLAAVLERLAPS